MLVWKVVKKKSKRIFPVMVEGKFLRRIQHAWSEAVIWADRKLGYFARVVLFSQVKVNPRQILFYTFQHAYACNPKYICEALLKRGTDCEIYWCITKTDEVQDIPDAPNVHIVKNVSYEYYRALAASKIIVSNSTIGDKFAQFPVKKEQLVFQTWHGSLGIKRIDLEHYNTNLSWPEAAVRGGKLTNYCISNSDYEDRVYRETYWQKARILKLGHARNDIFFDTWKEARRAWRAAFFEAYGLEEDTKLCLYAPTFRDTHNFAVYDLNAGRAVKALAERFGGRWKLLVRYHNNDRLLGQKRNRVRSADVIDVTELPDIQELLAFIDAGITDYSSWIYDFILGRKPGFIYARDIDLYNNERGFYFRLEEAPFPIATDNDALVRNILEFDEARYQERVDAFLKEKGCIDDGHAGERIARVLEKAMDRADERG